MSNWTRRDLVKAGLAASASVMAGNDLLAESRESRLAPAAPQLAQLAAASPNNLRERLLFDYGWHFAFGNANDPDKDFGFGKLRRGGTFAKAAASMDRQIRALTIRRGARSTCRTTGP